MLFMIKLYLSKPANATNKEFYGLWLKEADSALGALKAGVVKGLWKVASAPEVIAVLDVESNDALDEIILAFPLWSSGNSQIVTKFECIPLRAYENWYETLKRLAAG